MTAAQQLLLCVSRPAIDNENKERVQQLLRRGVNWEYLISTAVRHGVIPLLHYHLWNITNGEVPSDLTSFLEQETQKNTARGLLLTGELLTLLRPFRNTVLRLFPGKDRPWLL